MLKRMIKAIKPKMASVSLILKEVSVPWRRARKARAMIGDVRSRLTKMEYLRTQESCSSIRESSSARICSPGSREGGMRSMFGSLIGLEERHGSQPIQVRMAGHRGQWDFGSWLPVRQSVG